MSECVETAARVGAIRWNTRPLRRRSQARLVQEYLRRSALWRLELGCGGWPFFDIAHLVDPGVRASEDVVAGATAALPDFATFYVRRTVEWALHFAALTDAGTPLPDLPDPFAPLLRVYERGDGVNYTPAGFIEVDGLSVPRGKADRYSGIRPLEGLDEESLLAIDRAG
ncbi:hypothetical protein [Nocardiopsis tropica]|uniref:Uncharacterized protein n=1 Tax=Nocardiopsis tropica TaxID=109330 RepID=A0ABV1ZU73_9ACTN